MSDGTGDQPQTSSPMTKSLSGYNSALPFVSLIPAHQLPCRPERDSDEEGCGIKGRGEARGCSG